MLVHLHLYILLFIIVTGALVEYHANNKMLTVEQVIGRLREAAEITPSVLPEGSEVTTTEGPLFEKILFRLKGIKMEYSRSRLIKFNYVRSYEIGDMSGNQLLRLLVGILNDDSLCTVGNGILLSIGGEYLAAIIIICGTQIELHTTPSIAATPQNKRIFSKLFDHKYIESRRTNERYKEFQSYHTEDQIKQLRVEAQIKFPEFLQTKLLQSKSSFSHSFFNALLTLLFQIAQTEIKRDAYHGKRSQFSKIPVAACVKFVMESQHTEDMGLLTEVFGEEKVFAENGSGVSTETKVASGMKDSIHILQRALPHNNGIFAEEDVQRAAEEIKAFYAL